MSESPRPVGDFVWYDYMTRDIAAARTFYADLFDWTASEASSFEGGVYVHLENKELRFGGMMAQEDDPRARPDWLGYVWVDSLDDALTRVEAAGGTILVATTEIPGTGRFAVFADPCGAPIAAFERESGSAKAGLPSANAEGLFCWAELWAHDVDDARAFYQEVFGWSSEAMDMPDGSQYMVCKTSVPNKDAVNTAGIMASPLGGDVPAFWLYYIAVADTDACVARAKELGASLRQEPTDIPGVGRFAILLDPAGAAIGVIAPAAT